MMANAGAFRYCAENKATLNAWVSNKGELKEPSNYQEYKETTKDLSQEAKAYFTTKKKSDPLDVLYRTKYFSMAKSQILENGVIKKMKGNSDLSLVPADNMALDFQSATQNGLYLVGHGNTAADAKFNGTWDPKRLAAFLYLLGLARVTKLVLVACGLGTTQVRGQSYLTKFCTALADHDIYPKVAGWDQFVSVATPGNPVSTHINVSGNNIGKKIASLSPPWARHHMFLRSTEQIIRRCFNGYRQKVSSRSSHHSGAIRRNKRLESCRGDCTKRQLWNILDQELADEGEESPEFLAELDARIRALDQGRTDLFA